nr:hypothetical protein [Tanacetum cinerariifolium]
SWCLFVAGKGGRGSWGSCGGSEMEGKTGEVVLSSWRENWVGVLQYDGDECDKGIMQTKIDLTLEQSQQGVSNDVLVSIEGVEE